MTARDGDPNLGTRARQRACAEVKRTQPWICAVCLLPIPRDVDHQRHRLGHTVDEIQPRSLGGSAIDMANLRPMHRTCNSARSNGPITTALQARQRTLILGLTTSRTSRNW